MKSCFFLLRYFIVSILDKVVVKMRQRIFRSNENATKIYIFFMGRTRTCLYFINNMQGIGYKDYNFMKSFALLVVEMEWNQLTYNKLEVGAAQHSISGN